MVSWWNLGKNCLQFENIGNKTSEKIYIVSISSKRKKERKETHDFKKINSILK